jgi:phytoene dehydrogenase-like protein
MNDSKTHDAAVIGGGIAGLTAAILLARAGKSVILYERSMHVGGRAASLVKDGFVFNQGPHALYRGGGGIDLMQVQIALGSAYFIWTTAGKRW